MERAGWFRLGIEGKVKRAGQIEWIEEMDCESC